MDEPDLPEAWRDRIANARGLDLLVSIRIRTILRIATASYFLITPGAVIWLVATGRADVMNWPLATGAIGSGATGMALVWIERRVAPIAPPKD